MTISEAQLPTAAPPRDYGTGIARLVIFTAPVLVVLSAYLAHGQQPGSSAILVVALVPSLSAGTAFRPDSHFAVTLMALLVLIWLALVSDDLTPWTLVAALSLLSLHTAVAFATIAAPDALRCAATTRRWLRRYVVLAVLTASVWLLARGVHELGPSHSVALTLPAFAIVGTVLWVVRERSLPRTGRC